VNLASRLEGLNKLYGTWIIASQDLMERTGDEFEWRRLDRVAVKGRNQGTLVCELISRKGEAAAEILDAYFAADFEHACALFAGASNLRPDDLAAASMRERCQTLLADPPVKWDGIHIMHEK
jgi:adenylate cyclase